MEETLKIIRDLGVPIGMLIWFMLRYEKRMDAIQSSLAELVLLAKNQPKE